MINKKKAREYAFIAGVTIGLPVVLGLSGASRVIAQRLNDSEKQGLVYMLNSPEQAMFKESIKKNIEYIDIYSDLRDKSAKYGVNALALMLGFAGASCFLLAKRKLEGEK